MKLWIRVDASVRSDPELAQLAERVRLDEAKTLGHLVLVWCAVAEHRPNGNISGIKPSVIEKWAEWRPASKNLRGVFGKGILELFTNEHGVLRGWQKRQGKLVELMEKDRKRKEPRGKAAKSAEYPSELEDISVEIPEPFRGNSTETARVSTEIPRLHDEDETGRNELLVVFGDAIRLSVIANKGLAEHEIPEKRQPIARIIPTSGRTTEAVAQLIDAQIPVEFAERELYEAARTARFEGKCTSLKYFVPGIIRAWEQSQASDAATNGGRPPPPAARRRALHVSVAEQGYANAKLAIQDYPE